LGLVPRARALFSEVGKAAQALGYSSVQELADHLGVNGSTARRLLLTGKSLDAMRQEVEENKVFTFKVGTKRYTVAEAEETFGVGRETIRNRWRAGVRGQALVRVPNWRRIQVRGQEYLISEAAKKFGVEDSKLRSRIKGGWSPEEAVGVVPRRKAQSSANSRERRKGRE
jgi:hypothetical protein